MKSCELKETINTMVDQLAAFSSEVTRVAREVGTDGNWVAKPRCRAWRAPGGPYGLGQRHVRQPHRAGPQLRGGRPPPSPAETCRKR